MRLRRVVAESLFGVLLSVGMLGLGPAPASAATTVSMTAVIGDWHCTGGGYVAVILGFSNNPNGWTFSGAQPGNRLGIQAWTGQNWAYGAVTCRKKYWYGWGNYQQQIVDPMYYWGARDATVNL